MTLKVKFFLVCALMPFCWLQSQSLNTKNDFQISNKNTISFIENKGQVADQNHQPRPDVLFSGTAGQMVYHLKNNGISYQLVKQTNTSSKVEATTQIKNNEQKIQGVELSVYRIDVNWLNSNANIQLSKGNAQEGFDNYYFSHCPNGITDVKKYDEVYYHSIYKGIDVKWYQKDGNLKYDYIVAAGADYKQIKLKIEGAQKININKKGELVIETPLGTIIEQAPIVIQNRKFLKSKWVIDDNSVSFEIENINQQLPFVIDPVIRLWATYYGGSGGENGVNAIDKAGNVYIAGQTNSTLSAVMATSGAHQTNYVALADAFVAKFNSAGVRQWGTYYGGTMNDIAYSCALDANGDVYISGRTESTSAIATLGAHQTTLGGFADGMLIKFNSLGVRMWGTYYGGTGWEYAFSCATDLSGNVVIVGDASTNTGTVIATAGAHQSVFGGAFYDGFVVQFNSAGVRQWGTYYGGDLADYARACAIDKFGNIFVAGITDTYTGTAIATPLSHQSTNGSFTDAFLVKFNSAGVRQWGTYYGGSAYDYGFSCCTDTLGNAYLSGNTDCSSGTVIATSGAHQTTHASGGNDGYLVKFNMAGVRQWGTYYGTPGNDYAGACTADRKGNVYLTGYTDSNFPGVFSTTDSHQQLNGGNLGSNEAYLAKFNSNGVRQWGTYYGGAGGESGTSIAVDTSSQFIYLAGYTNTGNGTVIATLGSHQPLFNGGSDLFLAKFFDCNSGNTPLVNVVSSSSILCTGNSATLAANGANTYSWNTSATSSFIVISPTSNTNYTVTGYASNNCPHTTIFTQSVSVCTTIKNQTIVADDLLLFPNPANDLVNITLKNLNTANGTLSIYNTIGELLYSQKIEANLNNHLLTINTQSLPAGFYLVELSAGNSHVSKKLTIIK